MNHTRHSNIYNIPPYFNVGIVGAGGLGATTALAFAKMGVNQISIWDDDVVSPENVTTQLHAPCDIGMRKTLSMSRTLNMYSDEIFYEGFPERIMSETHVPGQYHLFVTAVDSITARQNIWDAVAGKTDIQWFLDLRMAAEIYDHFLVDMNEEVTRERYAEMLFSLKESDVDDTPCTARSTFYTSLTAAGHAGKALRDIVRGEAKPHRLVHYIVDERIATLNI